MNPSDPKNGQKANIPLIGALLISVGIAAFVQRQALLNPLAINDDVRNQIYWMARLVDPSLFPNDLIADYFTRPSLVSPVLWLVYWLAAPLISPQHLSQLLPLVLAPLATFFAYRFGDSVGGKRYGFLTAFSFNLIIWLSRNLAGGLARASAYPLLFALLWLLSQKNPAPAAAELPQPQSPGAKRALLLPQCKRAWGLILIAAIASLIYPPILFLGLSLWLSCFFPAITPGTPKTTMLDNTDEPQPASVTGPDLTPPAFTRAEGTTPANPDTETSRHPSSLSHWPKPELGTFLLGLLTSGIILIKRYLLEPVNTQFGALTNSAMAAQTPEFYERGRVPIFHYFQQPVHLPWPNALLAELLLRTPGLTRLIPLASILLAYWCYQKWLAPKLGELKVPTIAWRLMLCSILTYALAWPALFYLYVPERYLQLSMPLLYTVLLAGLLERLWHWLSRTPAPGSLRRQALKLAAALLLCLAIFSQVWDENLMTPDAQMLPVFHYLKQTPKNTLIATTPGLASDIPYYAQRSVLLSEEAYIPFHQQYFQTLKGRLKDFLTAYYSVTPQPVVALMQKYHLQYILVNTRDFAPQQTRWLHRKYYHSFPRAFYQQLLAEHDASDYWLTQSKPACRSVESGTLILLSAQAIATPSCWPTPQTPTAR